MKVFNILLVLALAITAQANFWDWLESIKQIFSSEIKQFLGDNKLPVGVTRIATASSYGYFTTAIPPTLSTSVPAKATYTPVKNSTNYFNSSDPLQSTVEDARRNPRLPNSPLHRGNWDGDEYNINTDREVDWPETGRTRKYRLVITNTTLAPQGVPKPMLVINGQYPGPLLEANWGDWFEIDVYNGMKDNGTSIHWHGFRQINTATEDGVGGITECPIAPGETRTYRFQADAYGSTWYHSHFSVQYGDGVVGPMVVHGPASANYDIDLGPVLLSDYYDRTIFQEQWSADRFGPPPPTNYLINGQNAKVDGSAGSRAQFKFTPGKKHLLRLVNTATDNEFKVQIDGHKMVVIAADFVAIKPYMTSEISLAVGQRYDVIVEANQAPGNYWLRALSAADCSRSKNDGKGTANAVVSYLNSPNPASLPTSNLTVAHSDTCADEPIASLVPIVSKSVDSSTFIATEKDFGVSLNVVTSKNDTVFRWIIGGISNNIDWNNPTLKQAVAKNLTFPAEAHVVVLPKPDVWTFWVIQNQFFVPHPMHLHGHDFALLGQGTGQFNAASDMGKLNFASPMRRDVTSLVAQGWTVIAFKTDNPGPWVMHCHIGWHAASGLALQFLERPDDIPKLYGKALSDQGQVGRTCKSWDRWSKSKAGSVYTKTDSGLKKREGIDDEALHVKEHLRRHREQRRQNNLRMG